MNKLWPPLVAALVGTLLFVGFMAMDSYRTLDSRLYDLMLRLKPAIEEDESILLLEVDDRTISEVNMYPIGRDIFADGLVLLAEFEPAWTMLDVEFVDRSPSGINLDYLENTIPRAIDSSIADLMDYNQQLLEGVLQGSIASDEARNYGEQLQLLANDESQHLQDVVNGVARDKDEYLAQAIAYLGHVTATLNMTDAMDATVSPELRQFVAQNRSINESLQFQENPFPNALDILPSIAPITEAASWSGFPRMHIDPDGVRRRVDMVYSHEGNFYTHMGFGTWWVRQGQPPIEIRQRKLKVGDLTIPLDDEGKMLINWPKRLFNGQPLGRRGKNFTPESVTHRLSFSTLYHHKLLLEDLEAFVMEAESYGIGSAAMGITEQSLSSMAASIQSQREAMLREGDGSQAALLGSQTHVYLEEAQSYFSSDIPLLLEADINALLQQELSPEDREYYQFLAQRIPELFSIAANIAQDALTIREELTRRLKDSTIVVGYTGTSTTDYGANPFEEKYMNMGIYGAVYNALEQGDFITPLPLWLVGIGTLFLSILMALLSRLYANRSGINSLITLAGFFIFLSLPVLLFIATGIYLAPLPLLLALLTVTITAQTENYMGASRERSFIQGAFGQIISPEVVKQIQANPDRLNISGETRKITAMFTDIEKFSTISEHLGSSGQLFDFLKRYLTPMSDIVLDELGTIDKYEGDAIIAFWNAPTDQEDHALRACRAALRMMLFEDKINQELIKEGVLDEDLLQRLPHRGLYTRVGLNTGFNNVGFIGTDRRKDYTALGDEMNLAARLEGVNKIYGTRIIISGATERIIHGEFITRQLDQVRVVGKENPVSIYELTCFREDFSDSHRQSFRVFHEARSYFLNQQWDEAEKRFQSVLSTLPGDGPSRVFVERCKKYKKSPPPKNWDGVYRMETK
ncbi:MAG: CHASE2 domain-containing protein [Spirochaetales bacterium]|nr:CHASE2 domain-containing protein [Spirochaetales bacterium]